MANISVTFLPDRTVHYTAWQVGGTPRTGDTNIPQAGGAGSGYYEVVDAAVVAGDIIRVTDSVYGYIGGGEYLPGTTIVPSIAAVLTQIETDLATLITGQNKVNNVFPDVTPDTRARAIYL